MMPPQPCARFIVIQAHFALRFLQARLDGPAQAADAHEFLSRTGEGGIATQKLGVIPSAPKGRGVGYNAESLCSVEILHRPSGGSE